MTALEKIDYIRDFINKFEDSYPAILLNALENIDDTYDLIVNNPNMTLDEFISALGIEAQLDYDNMLGEIRYYCRKHSDGYFFLWTHFQEDEDMLRKAYELIVENPNVDPEDLIKKFNLNVDRKRNCNAQNYYD